MTLFVADFEATTEIVQPFNKVVVTWAGLQSCDTMKCQTFQTRYKGKQFIDALDSFMNTVARLRTGSTVIFHNLKGYDHAFIFHWVLERDDLKLYGSEGDFYVTFSNGNKIRFFDSLNLLTTSIADMGKMVGVNKGGEEEIQTPLVKSFDRHTTTAIINNEKVIIPLPLDKAFKEMKWDVYAKHDCEILALGVKLFDIEKLLHNQIITKAGWAWNMLWKADYENNDVTSWLNDFDSKPIEKYKFIEDKLVKATNGVALEAYKGGVTYVNPKYQGQLIKKSGRTYDINSMYPWIYKTKHLPEARPYRIVTTGDHKWLDKLKHIELFIIQLRGVKATLKPGVTMPLIKNRADGGTLNDTDYLPEYNGILTVTSVEFWYLMKHYDVNFDNGFALCYRRDLELEKRFQLHCDYWYNIKQHAKTAGERFIAKLMLNAAYGKAAQYRKMLPKGTYSLKDGVVSRETKKRLSGSSFANVAAGAFITAYGRVYLAEAINAYGDDFVYCDTDSLHVFGDKELITIGDGLGEFKLEHEWSEGSWLNPKTYMERVEGGEWLCVTAGNNVPVKIEDFKLGNVVWTLRREYVPGGIVLKRVPFTLGNTSIDLAQVEKDLAALNWD